MGGFSDLAQTRFLFSKHLNRIGSNHLFLLQGSIFGNPNAEQSHVPFLGISQASFSTSELCPQDSISPIWVLGAPIFPPDPIMDFLLDPN